MDHKDLNMPRDDQTLVPVTHITSPLFGQTGPHFTAKLLPQRWIRSLGLGEIHQLGIARKEGLIRAASGQIERCHLGGSPHEKVGNACGLA